MITAEHAEEITVPMNYQDIQGKPDAEVFQIVCEAIAKSHKVLRSDDLKRLYIIPKTMWGAEGVAKMLQGKYDLSDEATVGIAEELQITYDMGVKAEKQRRYEEECRESEL